MENLLLRVQAKVGNEFEVEKDVVPRREKIWWLKNIFQFPRCLGCLNHQRG